MSEDILALSGNLFTFESKKCLCMVDITHEDDGSEIKTLRIRAQKDAPLRFAYKPRSGLVRMNNKTGSVESENILRDLLAIPFDDADKIAQFFSENGFIIPISDVKFESFPMQSISMLLQRIKFTVELTALLQAPHKNYRKILSRVCWLTFMPPVTLTPSDGYDAYTSCVHSFIKNEMQADQLTGDELEFLDGAPYDDPTDRGYSIPDSIHPPYSYIGYPDYWQTIEEAVDEYTIRDESLFKLSRITKAFKEMTNIPTAERRTIEFFYHFRTEIGAIDTIDDEGTLHFHKSDNEIDEKYKKYFNENMKAALVDVAKLTIKEEIDHALYGVTASYDVDHMAPAWYIPDLISSLYFSLFYLKSDVEIYRNCANPNCGLPFLVSTTNSRRKYCCPECGNAMAQRRYRKRKKEQASS